MGFGGGSAAQGASGNFQEMEPKEMSILICTLYWWADSVSKLLSHVAPRRSFLSLIS